ncbi:uncharacterized protein I303_102001 [Kwoniella dejecticola CBS 10117]|uniref:Uncharacterized protein n=1 Tax=Kwoniella dejecticola CBS 10117 TaxID=1296121 RepID=A0A1A6AC87_9TREE|nr:uncharacterized protein I303_01861 [Kwoniella dejecticola CBS 10117]OBR87653.1 hypothetical protein I303_01861 [Kwoniella dejecticola CBS 10117]
MVRKRARKAQPKPALISGSPPANHQDKNISSVPQLPAELIHNILQILENSNGSQIRPINVTCWRQESREMVKKLTIAQHDERWCRLPRPRHIDLPNLTTMRLDIGGSPWIGSLHSSTVNRRQSPCHLVKDTKPITLILICSVSANIASLYSEGRVHLSDETACGVEDLIFVSSYTSDSYWGYNQYFGKPYLSFPRLKKVFWVFDPTAAHDPTPRPHHLSDPIERNLLRALMSYHPKARNTVVNVGPPSMYALGEYNEPSPTDSEGIFRHHAKYDWADRYSKNLDDQQKDVKFSSLAEFLEEEKDWRDWFDEAEMVRWQKAIDRERRG